MKRKTNPDLIFFAQEGTQEVLRLAADGTICVRGNPIERDIEVVDAMRYFLTAWKCEHNLDAALATAIDRVARCGRILRECAELPARVNAEPETDFRGRLRWLAYEAHKLLGFVS